MRPLRFAIAVIASAALAGCSGTVPKSLLFCVDQPKSPAEDPAATENDAALYVVDLAAAGQDCRANLGSVRRILYPETN